MRPTLICFLIASATLLTAAEPPAAIPFPFSDVFIATESALPQPIGIAAIPNDTLLITVAEIRHDGNKPSPDGVSMVMYQSLVPYVASSPFSIDKRKELASTRRAPLEEGILATGTIRVIDDPEIFQVKVHLESAWVIAPAKASSASLAKKEVNTIDNEYPIKPGMWASFGGSTRNNLFLRIDRSPTAKPSSPATTAPDEQRISIEIDKPASTVTTWFARRIAPRSITLDPELNDIQVSIRLHDVTPDEALHKICDQEGWTLTQDASGYHIAPKSVPAKPQPNF